MYKINADIVKGEKDWTKVLDGYEIIFMEVSGVKRIEEIPADVDETMKFCMKKFINPKERKVLYLRYFGKMSLKDAGERLNLNAERIRQIQGKAIRKLRHSTCMKILRYGMGYYDKMLEIRRIQSQQIISEKVQEMEGNIINAIDHNDYNKLLNLRNSLNSYINEQYGSGAVELYDAAMPISTLMLSVRTYNCLRRAGYNTIGELEGKTYSDIMKIRNLGRKSFEELLQTCSEHGINIVDDCCDSKEN